MRREERSGEEKRAGKKERTREQWRGEVMRTILDKVGFHKEQESQHQLWAVEGAKSNEVLGLR